MPFSQFGVLGETDKTVAKKIWNHFHN